MMFLNFPSMCFISHKNKPKVDILEEKVTNQQGLEFWKNASEDQFYYIKLHFSEPFRS